MMKAMRCLQIFFLFLSLTAYGQYGAEKHKDLYPTGEIVSKYHNDWTRVHYRKRIADFINDPLQKNEIVLIGNSITEKGGDWSEKFGVAHIRNRGISGDVTDGVLQRLNEITHFQPAAVFILIGINDLYNLHHDQDVRSSLQYYKIVPSVRYVARNIVKITRKIHRHSPETKIYVRTILPTRREFLKQDILKVNALLTKYAAKENYMLINLYAQFVDDEGLLRKEYTNDGLHLNNKGYELWVKHEKTLMHAH